MQVQVECLLDFLLFDWCGFEVEVQDCLVVVEIFYVL